MKKYILGITILVLWFTLATPIAAQTPTPTPDPCSPEAPLTTPCPVKNDITNVVIPRQQTWVSSLVDSINKLLGQQVAATFNWTGVLRPAGGLHTGSDKLKRYGQQVQDASDAELNPSQIQAVEQHDQQQKQGSMTSVECVHDPQTGAVVNQFRSSEVITTKDIPGLNPSIEGSRRLGSFTTGYTQVKQDYNLKNLTVSTSDVTCEAAATGQEATLTPVEADNQNSYGTGGQSAISSIVTTITAAIIAPFQGGYRAQLKQTAEIQGKGLTPWIHYALCLFAGCNESDVSNISYDTEANKKQLTTAGGAVAAMYKPADVDDAYKSDLNAADPSQQWSISGAGGESAAQGNNVLAATTDQNGVTATAVNYAQGRVMAAGDYMNCALAPADYQGTAVPDGACNTDWSIATCNGSKLPDLTVTEADCKIRNVNKINDYVDVKLPQSSLPPTMVAIIEKAGETFHVKPSVILAVLGHEQGFNRKEIVWTEENVKAWSFCGQKMPFCSDAPNGTAQAPYGFFANLFYKDAGDYSLWSAVQKVDPSRTKDTISLCNFMDVTFAVAKSLSVGAAGRPTIDLSKTSCFGLPITNTKRPTSCSSSQWTDAIVLQSHVSYAGYCPDTNRPYPYVELKNYPGLIFKFTHNM